MASSGTKKINSFFIIVFLLIIIGFIGYIVWFVLNGHSQIPTNYQLGNFKAVDVGFLQTIKEFRACGDWPINEAKFDNERSNPFARKNLQISPMAASSTPECLPFNQR